MKRYGLVIILLCGLLAGTSCMTASGPTAEAVAAYEDLADRSETTATLGQVYRIGDTGICGKLAQDHIAVTHVVPGSPAAGKVRQGDKVRALQYRGIGGSPEGIRQTVGKRIFRLGRDWDWHLYLTVERPSLRKGKGNQLTFDLRILRPSDKQYHFGPTGFFATIHPGYLEVDHVVEGAPSADKLQVGDRIVAVDDEPIGADIFKFFTDHIDRAESTVGEGKLRLTVRRVPSLGAVEAASKEGKHPNTQAPKYPIKSDIRNTKSEIPSTLAPRSLPARHSSESEGGTPLAITLQLKVLGDYSDSSPFNCPKTDAIITQTADGIVARGKYGRLGTSLIALLATGEQRYIDHVAKVIKEADWAKPDIELPITGSSVSWFRAYRTLTLCEYYLLTGDTYVLPAIRTYANTIARGQDAAGLWNHQSANPDANFGKLHGRLYGYGAINQTSIALWISLILAQECGVEDPEVRAAVEKTHRLYSYWIGRGRLPYGNHGAGEDFFTNNGTSGSVAVGFALLDDKEGASFFSQMSAAAAEEVLTGHTGPWFNIFWSGIGANVAGPEMTKAYNRELHWLRTVTRTWDSRFLHMEAWGIKPGGYGLGSSGSTLLNLVAGRRNLRITGRNMDKSLWLDAKAARQVVDAGTIDYAAQTTEELLGLLGHHLPPVRFRAAEMLAVKDADVSGTVTSMLKNGDRNQRIGALHAISSLKIESALDELMSIVRDTNDDLWIRQLALRKLAVLDGASVYAPDLLALLVVDKNYDVQGRFDEGLGAALVRLTAANPYGTDLDRDQLYIAVGKLLDHKRQEARGSGMALLKNMPLKDLDRIADKMVYVIEDKDRTYVSYHGDNHRQEGLNILYGLNIDESLDLTLNTINEKVGRGWRARNRKAFMKTWGIEAKRVIPQIREVLGKEADAFVKIIEEAENGRSMISLEEARKAQD